MSMTDPIADLLTRVRNAMMSHQESTEMPFSKMREQILKILKDEGYVTSVQKREDKPFPVLKVELKYGRDRQPVIQKLRRISKPGRRLYTGSADIPTVLDGLGVNILSTSKGVMTGREARKQGVGGEILCEVY